MENWRRTYPLEHLQVEHSFHLEAVGLRVRPMLQFSNRQLLESERMGKRILDSYRRRGHLAEEEASQMMTFCNVYLYDLIAREVLPALGYPHASAMRHELEREGIPVDYCALIECPASPPQSWSHLRHSRYRPQQLFWRRAVPEGEVHAGKVSVHTHAVPLHWPDAEVVYPYPIYGCLTGVGDFASQLLRQAIYARYLDDQMNLAW